MKTKLCVAILFLAFSFTKAQLTFTSSNINLISRIDPETVKGADSIKYSGCWGWNQIAKNKEYAIVGSCKGTYFIDISAPATPTVCDYVAGKHPAPGIWREIKTYQNYCYVVSDDAAPNSFQIIDMQYLPDSVHVVYDGKTPYFERAHTIWIDGNKLYAGGITAAGGGTSNMAVFSLATPTAPALLRRLDQDFPSISYVHDMFVKNDTVYASCGNQGLNVYRLTPSNTFTAIGALTTYPESGYNHSSSMTSDGKTLIFCDETPNTSIKAVDITNLSNITMSSLSRPNLNSDFVGHNPYVVGKNYVFVSCYQDGLNLYDISNPNTPTLAGFFDTFPQGGASAGNNYFGDPYNGNWGAYPWFKSGLILACDMQNGVFILSANAFKPTAGFSVPSNICSKSITTFTDASTDNPTSWSWVIPGASPLTSTLQSPSVIYATSGIYTASLTVANGSGTNTAVKTITVYSTPVISPAGTSSICTGNSATITCSGASSFTWNPGALTGASVVVSPTTTTTYTVMGISGSCIGTAQKIVSVPCAVGINETSSEQLPDTQVYPNPTKGVLTVTGKIGSPILIYNVIGELILSTELTNSTQEINLSSQSGGIYLVRTGAVTKKIIKE